MKKFDSRIPAGRVTVPSLPREVLELYPSAFYEKDGNPVTIKESKEDEKEAFKSLTAWYACGNSDFDGFILPYLEDMDDSELIDSLRLSKRRADVPIEDEEGQYLYLTIAKITGVDISQVKEDIYHYPFCPKVDVAAIISEFLKTDDFSDLPIYMPTYERFFFRTRLFPPPMTEIQAKMSLLGKDVFTRRLIDNFFHIDEVDLSMFKETEESLRKKVGALNSDWSYISRNYIGKKYERVKIVPDMKLFDMINALTTYPDTEIVSILKADPPRNDKGIQFEDRRTFISAWLNSNMSVMKS